MDLGGGLDGKVMRYSIPGVGGYWLGLYWEWPVSVAGGERYQRVVLSVNLSLTANEPNEQRLISLARDLVRRRRIKHAQPDRWSTDAGQQAPARECMRRGGHPCADTESS